MTHPRVFPALSRRALLASTAAALAVPALAQPGKAAGKPLSVLQVVDVSPAQQDVAKDFLVGSRAAWQDFNSRGGARARPVVHRTLEVDGTPGSLRAVLALLKEDPGCVVLTGTAGDPLATALADLLRRENLAIAHAAPWLQNSTLEIDERTFPIFASRQEQIAHALRSLTSVGVRDIGAVYATGLEARLFRQDVERIAAGLKLRLESFEGGGDLAAAARRSVAGSPAILLFLGGTPELAQWTKGLENQRQRYLIALADVNLQTMQQMGAGRTTPVIATQVVPVVTAGLPIVRTYRDALARLFDEPPTPLSLAGFIAARYTAEVLGDVDGTPTRASVLAAFQRRSAVDVGGFHIRFDGRRRGGSFVTQSMLMPDGRVIG